MIVISFRGTASFENARTNLWLSRSDNVTDFEGTIAQDDKSEDKEVGGFLGCCPSFGIVNGSIHSGFQNSYISVQPFILDKVLTIMKEIKLGKETPLLYFVGHSLGGALATVCAYDLKSRLPDLKLALYTYGCPTVGDHVFARRFNDLVEHAYRIVCDRDIITTMPKFLMSTQALWKRSAH